MTNKNVHTELSTHDVFIYKKKKKHLHNQQIGMPNNSKIFGGKHSPNFTKHQLPMVYHLHDNIILNFAKQQ